jgi:hypothetical protein
VAADLISASDATPKQVVVARLKKRLYDNLGMAEKFARWAVETWASVLDIKKSDGKSAKKTRTRDSTRKAHSVHITRRSLVTGLIRNNPVTVSDDDFKKVFRLRENCRPVEYVKNDYKDNQDGTVTDQATGLMWQKSGSDMYITYKKAEDYIEQLNRTRFAGCKDWRLPTADELISLLEPEKQSNGLYINPVFDEKQI